MMRDYYFIIAAAGKGTRLDVNKPKQFMEYKEQPLYINIVKELEKNIKIKGIIIVTKTDHIEEVYNKARQFTLKELYVIEGGRERQDSIYKALNFMKENKISGKSIVGIQDGARPFIKQEYIDKTYDIILNNDNIDGVVVGVKAKDTIKIINEKGFIENTPIRENVMIAHTPQVFKYEILKDAYDTAYKLGYYGTDDSSLVEILGKKVFIFEGDYDNIKITTKEDLIYIK